jgi:hypothetical protein
MRLRACSLEVKSAQTQKTGGAIPSQKMRRHFVKFRDEKQHHRARKTRAPPKVPAARLRNDIGKLGLTFVHRNNRDKGGAAMADFTNKELDMMSRALERAMLSLRGNRQAFTTADLAVGVFQAAAEGVRCEETLAKRAVAYARASCDEMHHTGKGPAA